MKSQQIILAGIGMGSGDVITEEVRQLIEEADCLIGAERMLACAIKLRNFEEKSTRECTKYQEYRTEKIISYLQKHKEYKYASV